MAGRPTPARDRCLIAHARGAATHATKRFSPDRQGESRKSLILFSLPAWPGFERVKDQLGNELQVKRAELFLDFIRQRHGDSPVDKPAKG